jgi:hypothetical protein
MGGGRPDVALARWRLLDRLPLHGVGDLHDQLSHCPAWLLEALAGRDESWLNIFAEPELGFLWRSLAYWTEAAYRWHQVGHLLAEAWRPSLILTAYETPGTTRALRAGFHQHAVDSLSINHSGLGAEVSYQRHQGAEGYLAVLGEIEQASTRRYRGQPERVLVMGSLRRDFAVQRAAAPPRAPGETPVVVLLTGRGGQLYHPSYLPLRHLEAMRQIREVALRNPCIRFVIKQHPRYNHDLLYRLLGLQELPNVVLTTEELGSVLKSATLAVLLHYNGTAGLDVLGRGIPLLYLGTGRTVEPSFVDILEGGARAVESVSELEQEIRKLASDPAAREDLVAEQAGFYGRAVHAAGAAAVDVCLRLVERLRRPDDPAEMSACEPRLRWIVDMVLTVQEALDGHVDWHHRDADFRLNTCLRALRSRAAALDFSAVPHLEIPRLGSYLLALAVWERRRPDALSCSQLPRLRLLLAVYRTLPPALRPSLKCLRGYARAACLLDAHAPDCPAPLAASLHLLCALLSPGLWLRGCLHPPGAPPAGVAV